MLEPLTGPSTLVGLGAFLLKSSSCGWRDSCHARRNIGLCSVARETETRFLQTGIGIFIASILIRPENIIYAFIFLAFLPAIHRLAVISAQSVFVRPSESILPRRDLARITVGQPYSILPSSIGEYWKAARQTPWACLTMRISTPKNYSGLFFRQAQHFRYLRWFASAHYC